MIKQIDAFLNNRELLLTGNIKELHLNATLYVVITHNGNLNDKR